MKKDDKRARLKEWREQQRDTERKSLPLPDADMERLFDMLDLDQIHAWLDQHGGFCDCEVLANSEEAWRFASGRN